MSVDPALLEILRCPDEHHAVLDHDPEAQTLTCTECGRIFEIRDGIPVLLLDEARHPAGVAGSGAGSAEGIGDVEDAGSGGGNAEDVDGEGRGRGEGGAA